MSNTHLLGAAIWGLLFLLAAAVDGRWGCPDESAGVYVPAGAVTDADEGAAGEP